MKHTPGPWKAERIGGNYQGTKEKGMAFRILSGTGDPHMYEIGLLYYKPMWEQAEANARLIEGAPELLDRLEELVRAYENALDGPDWKRRDRKLLDECRAVIARIEGQP